MHRPVTRVGLVESFGVHLAVVDDVNVRLVNRQNVPLTRVGTQRHRAVNTGHRDAISRLDCIDEIIVSKHYDRVRRLTRRHVL